MIALNKKTDYGLIALCCLGSRSPEVVSANTIAKTYGMRSGLLMNVLKDLSRSGLIGSVRGSQGGYRLARPLEKINLAQLIEALQGPPRLVPCARENASGQPCDLAEQCPVSSPVRKVHLKLIDFFKNINLADLLDVEQAEIGLGRVKPQTR
ncbi:MAG: Rrf2 family transcriptional regulator [Sedimentisphaerales bacterium]|nr:Rrf2 family transcriptional regulator [Sedimentisphaerales bacterium]